MKVIEFFQGKKTYIIGGGMMGYSAAGHAK